LPQRLDVSSRFSSMLRPHPSSTLFPYTTLFRSRYRPARRKLARVRRRPGSRFQLLPALPAAVRTSRAVAASKSPAGSECPHAERSEEHTSELQSRGHLVCRLLLEKKKKPGHQTR